MSKPDGKQYDPETFWAERYSQVDVTRSGHIDLPEAYNIWLYRRKKGHLLRMLREQGFEPHGASVLEIATGSGVYVEFWKQHGVRKLVGIDISEAAVATLKPRFPEFQFYKRDLAKPGLTDLVGTGFGLVTAVDMLYHIISDEAFEQALANLAAATAPGGLLAINDVFMHDAEREHGYMRLRMLPDYLRALERAGFEVLSRRPTFFAAVQWLKIRSPRVQKVHNWVWSRVFSRALARVPGATGAVTYGIDRTLGTVLREGPSFEMMICRRRAK